MYQRAQMKKNLQHFFHAKSLVNNFEQLWLEKDKVRAKTLKAKLILVNFKY